MNNLYFIFLCICLSKTSSATDTLLSSQNITDGKSLVSPGGVFELGFFSPGISKSRYLGIWYKNIPVKTVVWVANRGTPINDTSGHLLINTTAGSLALLNKNKTVFWSSNTTKETQNISPVVQLLDDGNLILRDEKEGDNSESYLWQSFDYPSDTLLPGMKLGWDLRTGLNRRLTTWKSPDDPSPGDITWEMLLHNYPEPATFIAGKEVFRSGPWNGELYSGKPPGALPAVNFSFFADEYEVYATAGMVNKSALGRMMVNRTTANPGTSPVYYYRQYWIWSEEHRNWTLYAGYPRDPCATYAKCGGNGNCNSYCIPNVSMSRQVSGAELGGKDDKWRIGVIIASAVAVILAMFLVGYLRLRRRKNLKCTQTNIEEQKQEDLELPLFDFPTIESATNKFSFNNKLGEGGFGPVYKGTLIDGKEIAVKRLSRSSGQGMIEFRNEVILIAKLQHRNLVKLLGCCIQGEEKLLIYEYMPNKGLDSFIFDEMRRKLLDWPKRFHIICGIARGLLYLHQDSRLRIIHRDLKASNVLLDREMNPKISDFGLARTFGGNQTEGNTNRVVGTYGYMAPEYATEGQFSVKSDVFSFGILLLEIISGKKSKGFYHLNHSLNLIGNAWILWNRGRPLELIDEGFGDSCNLSEVLRCIHVSLLCVQQQPEDRPTMLSVVQMLCSQSTLPQPKEPGFSSEKDLVEGEFPLLNNEMSSNGLTITLLKAR
ncbi:hypothetical protein M0R45_016231 [Rubus argutus]|uniref:Receptor-like serine/threonine-protein kinase n=1 Tax=Rubus argutus TaxID=59490 RepID=A0AAW1XRV6_RUBAR